MPAESLGPGSPKKKLPKVFNSKNSSSYRPPSACGKISDYKVIFQRAAAHRFRFARWSSSRFGRGAADPCVWRGRPPPSSNRRKNQNELRAAPQTRQRQTGQDQNVGHHRLRFQRELKARIIFHRKPGLQRQSQFVIFIWTQSGLVNLRSRELFII